MTIVDLQATDNGPWQCTVRDDVRSLDEYPETVQVHVASPYTVTVTPEDPTLTLSAYDPTLIVANSSDLEVICRAEGAGSVNPALTWQIDGHEAVEKMTSTWTEEFGDGEKAVFLSLTLTPSEPFHSLTTLRCLSRQTFPNGTIIYETSAQTTLVFAQEEVEGEVNEAETSSGAIAGLIIVIVITVVVIISVALICYARKNKVWCYGKDKVKKDRGQNGSSRRSNRTDDPEEPEEGAGLMITSREVRVTPSRASTMTARSVDHNRGANVDNNGSSRSSR